MKHRVRRSDRRPHRPRERGYILLTLLLVSALMVIAAAIVVPAITFDIKREREAELIHRGVQYSRAIRAFTKATARYPLRLEELQNTDGRRFIRKLYKDPITGGDFRLIHPGDVHPATVALSPSASADPESAGSGTGAQDPSTQDPPEAASASPASNSDGTAAAGVSGPQNQGQNQPAATTAVPTGGVIMGVASRSKARTIREFNGKNHYNDWLFFYDPGYDRGLAINGPTSQTVPSLKPLNGASSVPGQAQPQSSPPTSGSSNQQ